MIKRFDVKNIAMDFFTINLAWIIYYFFRVRSGVVVLGSRAGFLDADDSHLALLVCHFSLLWAVPSMARCIAHR